MIESLIYFTYDIFFVLHLQSGDRFVVKVKPVQIKGVRMIVEHKIETLPDRKVCRWSGSI